MQLFYLKNYLYCPAKDIKAFRPPFLERAAWSRGRALGALRRARNPLRQRNAGRGVKTVQWTVFTWGDPRRGSPYGRAEHVHDCTMQ